MHRDRDHYRIFSRRTAMLAGGQALLLSTVLGRMYFLQVVDAKRYAVLAEQNRINLRLLAPPRGRILDRNGQPMADNQQSYRVLLVPEQTDNVDDTLDALNGILPLTDHDRTRILRDVSRKRSFVPVTVRENLGWEDVARIEFNTPDLPGVLIDVVDTRNYLFGALASPVLGYVSAVSEADLENQEEADPLLELPGFRIGKNGVEKIYDLALRGKAGNSQVEVNSVGRVVRELTRNPGQPGVDLVLTLDLELQKFAAERMGDNSAAAVVMDIHSGDILVLAAVPSYDPAAFNRGLTQDEWKALAADPKAPLLNKAISGLYPPGSTFKTMVSLAALEGGIITPDHTVDCQGRMSLGNFTWYCDKRHGVLNLKSAIERSCDVYFYDVARRVGIDPIAEMARKFGLGDRLEVDLPGERPGLIPNRAWKRGTYGVPWTPGEDFNAGIGQGYIQVTPLQLAVMAARLANGGFAVRPHLARDHIVGDEASPRKAPSFPSLDISPASLAAVTGAMAGVTGSPEGTAFASRITLPGMEMAGKTGTAQVHHLSKAEHHLEGFRKTEELPWKDRDHALFIAFAPVEAPRFACAVVVEHGGWGASSAAPIARDILIEVQKKAGTKPVAAAPETRGPA